MARRSNRTNVEWQTPAENFTWDHAGIEVLMDIRAELQALNRVMQCHNVQRGFRALERMDRRLAQEVKLKTRRKP